MKNALIIDPHLFTPEAISEETAAAITSIENTLKTLPSIMDLGAQTVREARKNGQGILAMEPRSEIAEWRKVSELGLEVPVRVFLPETVNGIYLHIHGGGHTIGSADSHDQTLANMAEKLNLAVVSIEYRLAPENPWPLPADDCEAAALWLVTNMVQEFGTDKIVIGGESAGAHLSAVTMLRLRDNHGYTNFSGANLVYGIYDLSMTPSLRNWGDRNLILNTPICEWFGNNLLPPEQYDLEAKRHPSISPLFANLNGMPPALFTVGTLDPIVDDTLFMAQKWLQAGNKTQLEIYPGGIHAFDVLPISIAREAREKITHFISTSIK